MSTSERFRSRVRLVKAAALSAPARNALGTHMVARDKDRGVFPYLKPDEDTVLQSA